MIKSTNCPFDDIERQLKLQLEYDPESTVISIVPKALKNALDYHNNEFIDVSFVKIIWNSK
jgi:hypothetical protein